MLKNNSRGIAAVELVYLLLFFLGIAAMTQRFSLLSGESHRQSIDLQNNVDDMMIQHGRPDCLEEMAATKWIENRILGVKRLTFVDQPICVE